MKQTTAHNIILGTDDINRWALNAELLIFALPQYLQHDGFFFGVLSRHCRLTELTRDDISHVVVIQNQEHVTSGLVITHRPEYIFGQNVISFRFCFCVTFPSYKKEINNVRRENAHSSDNCQIQHGNLNLDIVSDTWEVIQP